MSAGIPGTNSADDHPHGQSKGGLNRDGRGGKESKKTGVWTDGRGLGSVNNLG